ncbi:unnamed protein product [Knipowitschia caucasica]|uniref:C-type natriuretic peptide n=1 Tax=Knipowitschia caucasica TaxID=637954 RepID=A0AAV2KK01_KNICA
MKCVCLLLVYVSLVHGAPTLSHQSLRSRLGARLSALIMAPPPPRDVTEGSAAGPVLPALPLAQSPQFLLDLVKGQGRMWRGRGRKSVAGGGRGCFGMKMDRIGSISGLGC